MVASIMIGWPLAVLPGPITRQRLAPEGGSVASGAWRKAPMAFVRDPGL